MAKEWRSFFIKGAKARALSFCGFSDGTYNPFTRDCITYKYGYQVSFVGPKTFEQTTDAEYDLIVSKLICETKSREHVGVYEKAPETSFRLSSYKRTMSIAERYNQESIWDWQREMPIINPKQRRII